MISDRERLAWAAGFADGEGCFSMSRTKRKTMVDYLYPTFTIGQTHREVLVRFQVITGIGKINGPYLKKGNTATKPFFMYHAQGFEVTQAIAAMLWPWLGTIKRNQAQAVIGEFCRSSRNLKSDIAVLPDP